MTKYPKLTFEYVEKLLRDVAIKTNCPKYQLNCLYDALVLSGNLEYDEFINEDGTIKDIEIKSKD